MKSAHSPLSVSNGAIGLHVLVLFNFAVAQPLFDLMCGRMEFFRDLSIPASVVYGLAFLLSFGLPGLLLLSVRLAGLAGAYFQAGLLSLVLFLLMGLLTLPALKQTTFLTPVVVYGGSLIIAGAGTWLYWKSSKLRLILGLCAVGLPLFPALFLTRYVTSTTATYATTQKASRWTPAPVVMIVFDEFCGSSLMTPEREVDATRFPNFAALARDSQWFRNASSVHQLTMHAVPAILSGRYSEGSWPPGLAARPQNLFSMLVGNGGYEYSAFEPVSRLAPEANTADHSIGDFWTDRFPFFLSTVGRVYLYHLTPTEHGRCLPEVPNIWFGVRLESEINPQAHRGTFRYSWSVHRSQQFEHFLRTIDGDGPAVHFMHVLLPHVPWSYLPTGERYTEDGADWELTNLGKDNDRWSMDELQVTHAQQRYLLQVMDVDRLLGQLIDKLKSVGMYDESLLIVTADHGISFRPGEYRRVPSPGNGDEILSVPLFIKRPGEKQPAINDRVVETVDIFPTIADVLGYRLTQKVDGWSVFDERHPPRTVLRCGGQSQGFPSETVMTSSVPLEIRQRFGAGDDDQSIFRIGPIPELVGRRVADFPAGDGLALTLDVSRFGDEWSTDSDQAVPCFFEGQVHHHDPVKQEPAILAVAVNGVIQAVTRTYRHAAELSQWEALLPPFAFQRGHNDIQIYHVTGATPSWKLTPCLIHRQSEAVQSVSARSP